MEILSMEFLVALLSIIMIDLVLAGDNAIVIGMSAKNLPEHHRKKAIIWGTVGAVVIRILATLAIVWLLKIPGLQLVGGIILIGIAYKLLIEDSDIGDHKASTNLWSAIGTIVVADTIMGLDNVLAVAGAAHGNFLLVVIGLIISVPIMVWGSTLFIKLIDKYPIIIYIGSGVLAFTAARMITHEPFLKDYFGTYPYIAWLMILVVTAGVLVGGHFQNRRKLLKSELMKSEEISNSVK
ncbi:TerC family protein [Paenisporosarcina sp. TG20]|uniref:TerC family protein n=1 Tax=Paenisporosarcina sp. TG20 TaxID=1211706 RepID=UPI000307E9A9|nr:TerC family protein [Paenisporosarcina sp. TG20]